MNKTTVMRNFLDKNGGTFVRKEGKWYWHKDEQTPVLVTLDFLLKYNPAAKKEEVKVQEVKQIKKTKPKPKKQQVEETLDSKNENI